MKNIEVIRKNADKIVESYVEQYQTYDANGYDRVLSYHRATDELSKKVESGLIAGGIIDGGLKLDLIKYIQLRMSYGCSLVIDRVSSPAAVDQQTELINQLAEINAAIDDPEILRNELINQKLTDIIESRKNEEGGTELPLPTVDDLNSEELDNEVVLHTNGLKVQSENIGGLLDHIEKTKDPVNSMDAIFSFITSVKESTSEVKAGEPVPEPEYLFNDHINSYKESLVQSLGEDYQVGRKELVVKDLLVDMANRNIKGGTFDTIISDTWRLITYLDIANILTVDEILLDK